MSSSRSIAAARNRRAGGDPQPTSRTRPNTSIASQGAFSQQPMQQNRKMNTNNAPQQVQSTNKISISDAIGLITIRLGRVEQFIQESQEKGDLSFSGSENLQLIDKDVIRSLTERIYTIESKSSQNQVNNSTQLLSQLSVLEKEIKHLKEILESHTKKTDDFISETEQKFTDVDTAFVELEKNLQSSEVKTDSENIQLDVEESEKENEKPPTFSSVDLKNVIEEELANAEI
jgi:aldehyde:ferredoxin oxidoreductase